jgi:hypothetical protein
MIFELAGGAVLGVLALRSWAKGYKPSGAGAGRAKAIDDAITGAAAAASHAATVTNRVGEEAIEDVKAGVAAVNEKNDAAKGHGTAPVTVTYPSLVDAPVDQYLRALAVYADGCWEVWSLPYGDGHWVGPVLHSRETFVLRRGRREQSPTDKRNTDPNTGDGNYSYVHGVGICSRRPGIDSP